MNSRLMARVILEKVASRTQENNQVEGLLKEAYLQGVSDGMEKVADDQKRIGEEYWNQVKDLHGDQSVDRIGKLTPRRHQIRRLSLRPDTKNVLLRNLPQFKEDSLSYDDYPERRRIQATNIWPEMEGEQSKSDVSPQGRAKRDLMWEYSHRRKDSSPSQAIDSLRESAGEGSRTYSPQHVEELLERIKAGDIMANRSRSSGTTAIS